LTLSCSESLHNIRATSLSFLPMSANLCDAQIHRYFVRRTRSFGVTCVPRKDTRIPSSTRVRSSSYDESDYSLLSRYARIRFYIDCFSALLYIDCWIGDFSLRARRGKTFEKWDTKNVIRFQICKFHIKSCTPHAAVYIMWAPFCHMPAPCTNTSLPVPGCVILYSTLEKSVDPSFLLESHILDRAQLIKYSELGLKGNE
jgi:hypothetical protein